ncbi:MAG: ATP-binding protein [Candidatus Beckwithbacteria bacterium]
MKIKKITINKYGPIISAENIGLGNNLNIIVGRNGSGKTTLLSLINTFTGKEAFDPKYINKSFYTEKEGSGKIAPQLVARAEIQEKKDQWTYKIKQTNEIGKNAITEISDGEKPESSNKRLKAEYIKSHRIVSSTASSQDSPFQSVKTMKPATDSVPEGTIDVTASVVQEIYDSIIRIIFEKEEAVKKSIQGFKEELNNSLVDFNKEIQIDLNRPGNFIFCTDELGNEFDFSQLSGGEKEYLYFSFKLKSLLQQEPNSLVVLIDEPELHLHSSQLFKLAELIEELAIKNQVILATHSSELIDHFSTNSNFYLLKNGKLGKITSIGEQLEAFQALGIKFLSNYLTGPFLLIENSHDKKLSGINSPTTVGLVKRIIKKSNQRKIFISSMGSAPDDEDKTKLLQIVAGSSEININKVALLDSDKLFHKLIEKDLQKWVEIAKQESDKRVRYLPCFEIENLLYQPGILKKLGIKNTDFWEKIKQESEIILTSYFRTLSKKKILTFGFKKSLSKKTIQDQIAGLNKFTQLATKEFKDSSLLIKKVQDLLNEVITNEEWRWLPGKEVFKNVVLALKPNYWDLIKEKNFTALCEKDVLKIFGDIESYLLK